VRNRILDMSPKNYFNPLKTVARENFPLSTLISSLSKKSLEKRKVKNQGIRVPSFIKIP